MIDKNNNGDLLDNDTFWAIYSGSSAFRRFWDEYKEKIKNKIVIDLKNPPQSGEEGGIIRIPGTDNFRVQIRRSLDIDRNGYILAHEICHGIIFIQGYPECTIPLFLCNELIAKKENDTLKDLIKLCKMLNTLIYDPFVNFHLERFDFDLKNIYLKSSKEIPPYNPNSLTAYQEAKLGFCYGLMKIELSKYCPTELKKSVYLSWFEINCPYMMEEWLEIIQIMEKCNYCKLKDVEICILSILERYGLAGKLYSPNFLHIQPKTNLYFLITIDGMNQLLPYKESLQVQPASPATEQAARFPKS